MTALAIALASVLAAFALWIWFNRSSRLPSRPLFSIQSGPHGSLDASRSRATGNEVQDLDGPAAVTGVRVVAQCGENRMPLDLREIREGRDDPRRKSETCPRALHVMTPRQGK